MNLHLPPSPIPDRVSITGPLPPNQRTTHAEPDGPRLHPAHLGRLGAPGAPAPGQPQTIDLKISSLNTLPKMGDK